jgi:hypothetical protein
MTADLLAERHETQPYPRPTEAQVDRILADLLTEYRLNNLRPVQKAGDTMPPDHMP